MNKHLTVLLLLFFPIFSFAQEQEYKSKEQELYYKKSKFNIFKPLSSEEIQNYKNPYFSFEAILNHTPFSDSLYFTPYQDSIFDLRFDHTPKPEYIAKIDKRRILKHEKKGQIEAIIYESNEFEDFLRDGIWVAYSTNNGESWEYLYTGIVQQQPLYLKWYSKIPLINSNNDLQVEACLLRQLPPFPGPEYEVVTDGLLLTLDMKTLRKDSDNDGLTDIVETKFYTNLNNQDTDGDSIPDALDLNPRFSLPRTDKTNVFELVVNRDNLWDTTITITTPQINYPTETTETVLIVTDDPNIKSIQPKSKRIIILSEEEYDNFKGKYRDGLNNLSITPLFKVDNEEDTYLFTKSANSSGAKYLVKKKGNEWIITLIMHWMS